MRISIEVEGEQQVSRNILRVADRVRDARPGFKAVARYLQSVERSQFDSEGRTGSGGWAPLKERTLAVKRAKGLDPRILRAENNLRASLTNRTHPDHVERFSSDEMFFGTSDKKAVHHQHGAPRANVPQRKVIDLSERNRRAIVKKMQAFILSNDTEGVL